MGDDIENLYVLNNYMNLIIVWCYGYKLKIYSYLMLL